MNFDNIELAAAELRGESWVTPVSMNADPAVRAYLAAATPTRVHELIQIVKRQQVAHDNLVLEVAAEKQRADMLLDQAQHAAAAVQAEQQRYEKLAQELAAAKSSIPALRPLPKWIDDKKGSAPDTDALIEYIEQMRAGQPVQQIEDSLPPLPPPAFKRGRSYGIMEVDAWDAEMVLAYGKHRAEHAFAVTTHLIPLQPVQQPAPTAADLAAFNAYFCNTLSSDCSESEQLVDDLRVAAYDAWREATRRADARAALAAPVAAPVAEPVYLISYPDDPHNVWRMASEEAYHCTTGKRRRIFYSAAVPAASVQPTSIDGQSEFSRTVLYTIYRACQRGDSPERLHAAVMAEFDKQPDSGRDAALEDNEKYRMHMAAISTAALGYCDIKEMAGTEFDTPTLRDVVALYQKYEALFIAAHPANVAQPVSDAATAPTRPTRINLKDGAWLESRPKTGDWIFKRSSGFTRYLDEFEAEFIEAAIAAAKKGPTT